MQTLKRAAVSIQSADVRMYISSLTASVTPKADTAIFPNALEHDRGRNKPLYHTARFGLCPA